MLLGFVTFPITARLLTETDFGIIGYFGTFSLIWVAILKLGSQQSILRFYSSHCHEQAPALQRRFYATLIFGPAVVSTALFILTAAALFAWGRLHPNPMMRYLFLVLAIGHLSVLYSFIDNFVRARELSGFSSTLTIAGRVLSAAAVIAIIYFLYRSAYGLFLGQLLSGAAIAVYAWWWFLKHYRFSPRAFNRDLFRQGFLYGMPLVFSEISMVLLAFVDRVMLKSMLGNYESVGVYYLGYSLAMNFGVILGSTTYQAFAPVANRMYDSEGAERVRALKHRVVKALSFVAVLICCFLLVIGGDFFTLLAGAEKAASVPVFQWIGFNYALMPIFSVAAYGLMLVKRSKVIAGITMIATVFNVLLNLVLIPRYGMMGCVYATVASYLFMGAAEWMLCPRDLRTSLDLDILGWPIVLGVILVVFSEGTHLFGVHGPIPRMLVMTILAVLLYALPTLWVDPEMRALVSEQTARFRVRR
jgi:O-antigen/teichoic acid export membrane protein